MLTRIVSGLVGLVVVVFAVFWRSGDLFAILAAVVAIGAMLEFYSGARRGGARPQLILGLLAGTVIMYFGWSTRANLSCGIDVGPGPMPLISPLDGLSWQTCLIPALVLISLGFELVRARRAPLVNVGVTLLGVAYIPWLLVHLVALRDIGGQSMSVGALKSTTGAWLVMMVLLSTWATDTGAYFVGKFYGRHKLAPHLSPGKTWEGSVGGLALSIIVAAVFSAIIDMPQPHGIVMGAIIGSAGQIGDLAESSMKREVGIKDFGRIMPGHGGILDRIDSLLFTGPIAYWYVRTFLAAWVCGP